MLRGRDVLTALVLAALVTTGFSGPFQAAEQKRGLPWWVWALIILALLVLLFLWWWQRPRKVPTGTETAEPSLSADTPAAGVEVAEPPVVVQVPAAEAVPAPPEPDDLKRIEGIGPKISDLLQAAGIMTFVQLAATDVEQLEQIVKEAGIRLAYPSTWPEQAGLAAAGEWEALEKLQEELKWGRRVV